MVHVAERGGIQDLRSTQVLFGVTKPMEDPVGSNALSKFVLDKGEEPAKTAAAVEFTPDFSHRSTGHRLTAVAVL